jgi:hypothetical protein
MGKAQSYIRGASVEDRFWAKVARGGVGECWEWLASLDTRGYGNFGMPRGDGTGRFILQRAHRVAWELTNGPLSGSWQHLCHTCDNRKCVNPSHLFVGDAKANMIDCSAKGRFNDRKGVNNPRSKLSPQDVLDIRVSAESLSALSLKYGVVKSVISSAKKGKTWGHL